MPRTILIRLAAALLLAGGVWVAMTQQPPPAALTIEKVKDDLYNISGSGGNVAAYLTDNGVVLVDDKFPQNVEDILAKVKSVSDRPVKYVLNTHQHGDHTGGNEKLMAQAEVIAHRNARVNMVQNKQPGAPRISFTDQTEVYLGGKEVRARHFGRGHTNGDAVIYFPAQRVVHMGDLFVTGAPFIDYSAGGSALEWTRTIDAALELDFDTVIPGHGAVSKREDLVKWRNAFETFRTRMSELRGQGKSKEEAVKLLRIDDLGWKPSPGFQRSLDGVYEELGRR